MSYAEIQNINGLEAGRLYACCWKNHGYKHKTYALSYVTVYETRTDTKSKEFVKTSVGNRRFSKMRWFGPFPTNIDDV